MQKGREGAIQKGIPQTKMETCHKLAANTHGILYQLVPIFGIFINICWIKSFNKSTAAPPSKHQIKIKSPCIVYQPKLTSITKLKFLKVFTISGEKKNLNIQGRCETLVVILARKMHLKNNPIQM